MSTYVAIGSVTLSSAQPSVTFLGIPQTYTDLIIRSNFTCDTNATILQMTFNSDSSSSYSRVQIWGNGSATGDLVQSNQTSFAAGYWQTGSGNQIQSIVNLMSYSNSSLYKSWLARWNQVAGIDNSATMSTGMWRNTNAITSIRLAASTGNFNVGSTFDIYGINAANSGQAKAVGGDTIVRDASYWYHVFNKSGTFITSQAVSADILVVAGGGGGFGEYGGGGGGAGGLLAHTSQSLSGTYTVTVGAGGVGAVGSGLGSNSQFGSLTASIGGGYGGTFRSGGLTYNGASGGSGGGGGAGNNQGTSVGGSPTSGQGNAGGNGSSGAGAGGGGGGAGAAGSSATSNSNAGQGGIGSSAYSSWGAATSTGHNVNGTRYYAGGGGGGAFNVGTVGQGGAGGGGAGGTDYGNHVNGTANTGGGGGGPSSGFKTNGGSGIIIVRYSV